jgi:hypothetical protein
MNRGRSNRQAVEQGWLAGRSIRDIIWDAGSRAKPNWVIKVLKDLGQWSDKHRDQYKETGDARLAKGGEADGQPETSLYLGGEARGSHANGFL